MKNELEIIKFIRKIFPAVTSHRSSYGFKTTGRIIQGIGDDAAVLRPPSKDEPFFLLTTDMMVEGIHFDLSFTPPFELGFKLVTRNISDIFAMAGDPEYLLLDVCLSKYCSEIFIKQFFNGIKKAIQKYHVKLIGGDLCLSSQRIFLSATLIGSSKHPVYRSGALPGDHIYVTGMLGDSSCGLKILRKKLNIKDVDITRIIKKHLMPEPRPLHKRLKNIHAMIDISDGLSIDLWRLCSESKVGAIIYEDKIPISDEMKKIAESIGINPLNLALNGGEDYELLFTTDQKLRSDGITEIGSISENGFIIVGKDGVKRPLKPEGYIHKLRIKSPTKKSNKD